MFKAMAKEGFLRENRAYLRLPKTVQAKSFSLNDMVTSIEPVAVSTAKTSPYYYTLDGLRLQGKPHTPGVYIFNGQKMVIAK